MILMLLKSVCLAYILCGDVGEELYTSSVTHRVTNPVTMVQSLANPLQSEQKLKQIASKPVEKEKPKKKKAKKKRVNKQPVEKVQPKPTPTPVPEPKVVPKPEPKPEPVRVQNTQPVPTEVQPQQAETGWMNFEFTHYTAYCEGCSGVTSTGIDVRNTTTYNGMRIIAVNPQIIPYYTVVEVVLSNGEQFNAIALDTGSAMRKRTDLIDILVGSESEAYAKGRVTGKIRFK